MVLQRIKISGKFANATVYLIDIQEDNRIPLKMVQRIFPGAALIGYEETDSAVKW